MPNSDVIQFECPKCLKTLRVSNEQAGKRIDCPECSRSLKVPMQSVGQDLFDDLFDSPPSEPAGSESPKSAAAKSKTRKSKPKSKTKRPKTKPEKADGLDLEPDLQLEPDLEPDLQLEPDLKIEPGVQLETDLQLASESDHVLDDGVDLIPESMDPISALDFKAPTDPAKLIEELEAKDPFKVDPNAPIKVDGVGELFTHDDVFGIKCRICDTRIHVRPEQVGTEVKCPVCYSEVKVQVPVGKKAQKWDEKGKGVYTSETETNDLKLSEPIERPKVDIDESFGLAPVEEDLLAPKAKPAFDPEQPPKSSTKSRRKPSPKSSTSQTPSEEAPLLEIMDDDEELEVSPAIPLAKTKKTLASGGQPTQEKKRRVTSGKSRRAAFEAAQRRQEETENATSFNRAIDSSAGRDFPGFNPTDLFASSLGMLKSKGVVWRVGLAIALLCFGGVMMEILSPSYPDPDVEDGRTMVERIVGTAKWAVIGGVPYLIGLGVLWWTCSFLFRDAALGMQAVKSWKTRGTNEMLSTVLIFAFGLFIGGLPALFFIPLILPLRFCLGPLFLIGAWHNQSPFQIISVDAFNSVSKNSGQWIQFYICMGALSGLGLICGFILWLRAATPMPIDCVLVIINVLMMVGLTLVFAPICGWHCGRVMQTLENSD